MCEKCEQKRAELLKTMTDDTVRECRALLAALDGDFSEAVETMENIDGTETPDSLCAFIACRVALLAALHEQELPFLVMGGWATLLLSSQLSTQFAYEQHAADVARDN